ncbi:DUF6671 family protein [Bosea beijingensis]
MLATMHGKEAAIAPVLLERLGLALSTAPDLDTDALGTFTGEIPRAGAMRDAAVAKARLGMGATGLPIGIASEGSYGPHPHVPLMAGGIEILVLVDDTRRIVLSEVLVHDAPVYDHAFATTISELGPYLDRTGFPDQALIVKPSDTRIEAGPIYKGLRCKDDLAQAITRCAARSSEGRALVQTDMRAHMNPTRMATLSRLAIAFVERLATSCPACGMPGYGQVDVETGLPCDACGAPSIMVRHRLFGCVMCSHREMRPRPDGRAHADPRHCPECNP